MRIDKNLIIPYALKNHVLFDWRNAMHLLIWIVVCWIIFMGIALILRFWPDTIRGSERKITADEFIALIENPQVTDAEIVRIAPKIIRRTIEDVRRINQAIMEKRFNVLGQIQSDDHNDVY